MFFLFQIWKHGQALFFFGDLIQDGDPRMVFLDFHEPRNGWIELNDKGSLMSKCREPHWSRATRRLLIKHQTPDQMQTLKICFRVNSHGTFPWAHMRLMCFVAMSVLSCVGFSWNSFAILVEKSCSIPSWAAEACCNDISLPNKSASWDRLRHSLGKLAGFDSSQCSVRNQFQVRENCRISAKFFRPPRCFGLGGAQASGKRWMGTNRGTSWWLGSTTCRTYSISRRPERLETGIAGTLFSRNTWHWKISPLFGGL